MWRDPNVDPPPEKLVILVIGDGFIETAIYQEGAYYPASDWAPRAASFPGEVWYWKDVPYLSEAPEPSRKRVNALSLKPGQRVALANPSKHWQAAGNEFEFVKTFEEWSDALLFLHVPSGERRLLGKHNIYEVLDD